MNRRIKKFYDFTVDLNRVRNPDRLPETFRNCLGDRRLPVARRTVQQYSSACIYRRSEPRNQITRYHETLEALCDRRLIDAIIGDRLPLYLRLPLLYGNWRRPRVQGLSQRFLRPISSAC